ncbi:rhomboid family intramembrane serine protease GlpG [Paraglaciecola sp. L3A3]|uniref:rhomboid family intramembrane serine protease GlpG n=1 Tax=Paraglaciecola sp. L3A3 TaxID=2686358 RepID=UPI00131DB879|nr:rhomboid family intramembrane serine protease GlpG [Paraglaciecola sp. L3A3]
MSNSVKLVAFSKEQPARLLAHYLLKNDIAAEYSYLDSEYAHAVILLRSEQEEQAKTIAEEFILNPNDGKYQSAAWDSASSVELVPEKSFSIAKVIGTLKTSPFTASILLCCVLLFILGNIGIIAPYQWLRIQPIGELVESHQWWRIIGPAFFHGSFLHISFNLVMWWVLGKQIERFFGISSLFVLLVLSASISNISQLLVVGPNFVGLSGVVYALVGCVWWLGWLKPDWGIWLPKPIIGFLLVWLVVGYIDILPIHMANTAHTVGLICGCAFAWWLVKRAK